MTALLTTLLTSGMAGLPVGDLPCAVFDGANGPGAGKHIVFVTGEEEYRSEESMPQLAKILAEHHGFKCTVLFAVNPGTGEIDPETLDNIPGLEALAEADLMVLFIRFRELPVEQMKQFMDYVDAGRPMVALRTSTHAFNYVKDPASPYARLNFDSVDPQGGFGRAILGETWVSHYGDHQIESTRASAAPGMEDHPIVRGCDDMWGPSDVYGLTTLSGDSTPVVMGQVLSGMNATDPPNTKKGPMPVAWTRSHAGGRQFVTTMGHAGDLHSEGVRRMLVNGCYWALGMEDAIKADACVDLVGAYAPNDIGVGGHKKGLKPADHER